MRSIEVFIISVYGLCMCVHYAGKRACKIRLHGTMSIAIGMSMQCPWCLCTKILFCLLPSTFSVIALQLYSATKLKNITCPVVCTQYIYDWSGGVSTGNDKPFQLYFITACSFQLNDMILLQHAQLQHAHFSSIID